MVALAREEIHVLSVDLLTRMLWEPEATPVNDADD
jgi:hypothetical protein